MKTKQVATIGINVSKKTLDTALMFADGSYLGNRFRNNTDGIKRLLIWIAKQGRQGCPLGLKAIGILELELCLASYQAKHSIHLVMSSQITASKSLMLRNKTGGNNARLIAQFVMTMPTVGWQPSLHIVQLLHDLLIQRCIFAQAYTLMKNSLSGFRDHTVRRSVREDIDLFKRRLAQTDASIDEAIAEVSKQNKQSPPLL